ncbi:MAG TPA: hypothetical protein VKJ01_20765, partial [Candidatus Solibacter sp.]|nr:hypothetical protein [Candidatus Solibacter sp.]
MARVPSGSRGRARVAPDSHFVATSSISGGPRRAADHAIARLLLVLGAGRPNCERGIESFVATGPRAFWIKEPRAGRVRRCFWCASGFAGLAVGVALARAIRAISR